MFCKIGNWYGRLGNNLIQILNCLYYARENHCSHIVFPAHAFFTKTHIYLVDERVDDGVCLKEDYFYHYTRDFGVDAPPLPELRNLAQEFVCPIFKIDLTTIPLSNTVTIHIRSGDIFNSNPHKYYIQPPLWFYSEIIKRTSVDNVRCVYEDLRNPCASVLSTKFPFTRGSLVDDLIKLFSAETVVCGLGTFGFIVYFLSKNLKQLILPSYCLPYLHGSFRAVHLDSSDVRILTIDLPGYIQPGEWENTPLQRQIMIEYHPDPLPEDTSVFWKTLMD